MAERRFSFNAQLKIHEYQMPDMDPVVAETLITAHAYSHSIIPVAKAEKVKLQCISSSRSMEDWQYFRSRLIDYVSCRVLAG